MKSSTRHVKSKENGGHFSKSGDAKMKREYHKSLFTQMWT
jgi:hypothetical protein